MVYEGDRATILDTEGAPDERAYLRWDEVSQEYDSSAKMGARHFFDSQLNELKRRGLPALNDQAPLDMVSFTGSMFPSSHHFSTWEDLEERRRAFISSTKKELPRLLWEPGRLWLLQAARNFAGSFVGFAGEEVAVYVLDIPVSESPAHLTLKDELAVGESLLPSIWRECLGERPIPFDPALRSQLIADAEKHAELKRHLDAWRRMTWEGKGSRLWALGDRAWTT